MRNKIILTFMGVLIVAVFILFVPAVALAEEDKPNILFIFDSSGSMMDPIGDVQSKLEVAKKVLSSLAGDHLAGANVGLMAYGHREKTGCDDIEILVPIGKLDVNVIKQKISSLDAKGNTPIASALERAANEIQGLKGKSTIVLISDGEETCGGDPIRAAEIIRKRMGINVIIQVIGFDVDDKAKQQLAGIAQAGGGKYYAARDAEQLKNSLIEIKKEAVVVKEPEVYFFDDFDGEDLAEHWEVLNPNPDAFIVEDGKLMVISTVAANITDDKVENTFRLTRGMPDGDWDAVVKLVPEIQTLQERMTLSYMKDGKNRLTVMVDIAGAARFSRPLYARMYGLKYSKGKVTKFERNILTGLSDKAVVPEQLKWFKNNVRAIYLKMAKRGRSYVVSTKIEGDATTKDGKKPEWVSVQKLTSLRPPGTNLVLAFPQRAETNGESIIAVDWVKIVTISNK